MARASRLKRSSWWGLDVNRFGRVDRHGTIEPAVEGAIDLAHPAGAEQ